MRGKIIKKLCAVSLSAMMVMGAGFVEAGSFISASLPVYAASASTPASSFRYEENADGSITISGYRGSETELVIPGSIDGKKVTSIGGNSFANHWSLISVSIPDSVTSIEEGAFQDCTSLASVTIPDSVTSIEYRAFFNCSSLTSIAIPDSVTSIGTWALHSTAWYNSQPDGLLYAGKVVYKYKGEMPENTRITLRKSTKGIAGEAFYGCSNLASITIPANVTSIEAGAFNGCSSLTSITIPDSVTSIASYSFENCTSLASITIPDSVTSIGYQAFYCCSSLTSITIPDSVTSIEGYSFKNCTSLASITIPDSVTSIEGGAFDGCSKLSSITIPDSVTSIEGRTFSSCLSLSSITIPDSVTNIGDYAFYGCLRLASITIPDSVTSIGSEAFNSTAWYDSQPDGLVYAGKFAYKYKGQMPDNTRISLRKNTKGITGSAFADCKGLASITIPNSVEIIGDYAFAYCDSLSSIIIPDSVTSIGDTAFSHCSGLTSITMPDSMTSIGTRIFEYCSSLASITIPEGVTSIGDTAFSHCFGLTSVTIPDSVTSIGSFSFEYCTSLASITIPNSVEIIGDYAFVDCSSLASITIPSGVTSIGDCAFGGCSSLASITIPQGVNHIYWDTFSDCTSLTSVIIPNSVTDIGVRAFRNCSSLASITIPDSVKYISDVAFEGCDDLTIYCTKGSYAEAFANENGIPFKFVLNNISTISDKAITLGKTVTINCAATGGTGDYTYAVYYKKSSASSWTTKQKYSTNSTVTFKPASAEKYNISVKVKDSSGKTDKKAFTVNVYAPLKNTSTVASANIGFGDSITVKAKATSGLGTYKYEVYYKQESAAKWTKKQSYSTNSTVSFKPKAATTYDVSVKVKDSSGTVVKKRFKVNVTKPENTSTIKASTISLGESIRITCSAKDGSGSYTYAVYYKRASATKWTTKQNYSANTSVSIKPSAKTTYNISVKVKDSLGNISKKYFDVTVK